MASRGQKRPLPKADFSFIIDFDKSTQNPDRIFRAAADFIKAFEELDHVLAKTINSKIEPIFLLEDIEVGSLRVFLKQRLESVDDEALKHIDWKPQIGKYLVKGKYMIINFLNKDVKAGSEDVAMRKILKEVKQAAEETGVLQMPTYGEMNKTDFIKSADNLIKARGELSDEDTFEYVSEYGTAHFKSNITWSPERIKELFIQRIEKKEISMLLLVRKPDYLGETKWEFRFKKNTIIGKILDEEWLHQFQTRVIDVRPGDSLKCLVKQEISYDGRNEIIDEKYEIIKVEEIIKANKSSQNPLF